MRNMSFAKTTEQVRNQTKCVTRRWGWWFLERGVRIQAVEKGMGLKKGEKVKKLAVIEVVSVRAETLADITEAECVLEGFPEMSPCDLKCMLGMMRGDKQPRLINRIEFKYVD